MAASPQQSKQDALDIQRTIKHLEQQNALILRAAGEGIFGLDLDGNHTFVNPAAASMLGYEPDELVGQPSHSLWHHTKVDGSEYPKEECPIYGAYKDGEVHHGDTEIFWRKNGSSFPVEYTSTPLKDDAGKIVGAVVTFQDISKRQEAEQSITELRRHNDRILNAAGEGIFGLDLDGRHTFVNPAAAKMLGYELQELIGQHSHALWHHTKVNGSVYPKEECPIYGAYKDGQVHFGDTEIFWRKDGSSFPAEYTSTPMWDDQGALAGAVVTFQDITEKKEMAARLLEEAKLAEVTRMLGDIGHDIKNMLMPVLNGTWLLQDELNELFSSLSTKTVSNHAASQKLSTEIIEMIGRNARRIQDRVREIADAVKGVTSPPNFASCEIAKIVEEVYQTLRTYAGEKGISLNTSDLESLPIIEADERRLFNALYNLVNNAIPEVPSGGSVTIRGGGKTPQGMIELIVADTGRGMSSDIRDRLFTSRAVSTKTTGTGLGTKIVKDVIDLHQGHIRVESEQGKGTTFYIQLPMTQAKATHTSS